MSVSHSTIRRHRIAILRRSRCISAFQANNMNAAIPSANAFTYCGWWTTAHIVTHDVVLSTFTAGPSPITHVLRHAILSSTECSNGGKMARAVLRARCTSSAALHLACFWAVVGDGLPDVATTVKSDG